MNITAGASGPMGTTLHVMSGAEYDVPDTLEIGFTFGHLSLTLAEAAALVDDLRVGLARMRRHQYGPVT